MWNGLEHAATVAQLVGVDALGLISQIRQAARTARRNSSDCEHLARRVGMLAELLPRLRHDDPAAFRPLAELRDALAEAHDLVVFCHGRGRTFRFLTAGSIADRFRDVERKIDCCIQVFTLLTHIAMDRRLPAVNNAIAALSPPPPSCRSAEETGDGEVFTLAEIIEATDNFGVVLSSDADGDAGTVYRGRLHDGREVAVKRLQPGGAAVDDAFGRELAILAPIRHGHIARLVGWCAEDGERLVVTQLTGSGSSLHDHLHGRTTGRPSSPVAASWKARVEVLLGAARGVEHLHRRAVPLVIHGGVTSSSIVLDAAAPAWEPRLSGFGAAVWRAAGVDSQPVDLAAFVGAAERGYADPELLSTGRIRPASDVYSLGVVMLEALTGKPPAMTVWDEASGSVATMTLASFALPSIRAGRLVDVLDRRPAPELTAAWQLEPLQMVANTAARCLWLHGDNRPAISEVVADLEQALELMCRRGHF